MMSSPKSTALLLGLACSSVSVANLLTKAFINNDNAVHVIFLQIAAGTVLTWGIAVIGGQQPRALRHLRLGLPGILQPGLAYCFAYLGLTQVSASVHSIIFATETGMVALLAWPLLRERPGLGTILSILFGMGGVVLLSHGGEAQKSATMLGVGLVLAGVLMSALDTIAARALVQSANVLTLTAASNLGGLLLLFLLLIATGDAFELVRLDRATLLAAILSGCLLHGLAGLAFNLVLGRLPAALAATLFPLVSLMTTLGGILLLGERLMPRQWLGGFAIFAGVMLAVYHMMARQGHCALPRAAGDPSSPASSGLACKQRRSVA